MEKKLKNVISQIREDIYEEDFKCRKEQTVSDVNKPSLSEIIADRARKKLKPSGYKPTKEEQERVDKEIEKEKNARISKIRENPQIPGDLKEKLIHDIEIAFQKNRSFHKVIDIIGTGEFYQIKHKGKTIQVIINQGHGFYKKIYERATQDPYMQTLLDLFIFTLALAEDIYFDNEDVKGFYDSQRREWSSIMSTFLEEGKKDLEENQ